EYYEKNGRRWLAGGSVNDSFFGLNEDIEGYALAAYLLQVAAEITGEGSEAEEVLRMTLNTLYAIEHRLKPYGQIKAVYELFAAVVSGMAPDLSACSECGAVPERLRLDVMNGVLICEDCLHRRFGGLPVPDEDIHRTRTVLMPLDSSALAAMRYVENAPPARMFAFGLSDGESLRLFSEAAESFLLHQLERDFETLRFYRTVTSL
ncbi:MAG: DNA repair protein RecO C-terminal domain-containing protein, partial [Clostridia bacterium]|nr:DNA repair protein RecO C-terminal domain-containing protein [Clostridia bacterium]